MVEAADAKEKQKSKIKKLVIEWLEIFGYIACSRAIHLYCIGCCGGNRKGPGKCEDVTCELWPWSTSHSKICINKRKLYQGKNGKFIRTADTVGKRILRQITTISEGVFVPKKEWDEIQEKLKRKNEKEKHI